MNFLHSTKGIPKPNEQLALDSNYLFDGNKVPRVTKILSVMNDEYITDWANSLGFRHKKYQDELDFWANIGTIVHDLCDKVILGESFNISDYPREISNYIYNCVTACKIWWDNLNKDYDVEVIFIEKELSCEYYGGTCDILLKINGKYILGDFKTSNHIGYKYWCQLSAYANILNNMGYDISGVFILQLNKKRPIYKDYVILFDNYDGIMFMNIAFDTFCNALMTYIMRYNLDNYPLSYNTNYDCNNMIIPARICEVKQ